jgi:hypothetical protein
MKRISLIALAVFLALAPFACSRCGTDSETAKKQAFEAKAKPETVTREFDPKTFGTDSAVQERMFSMHWVEATHRLGDTSFRQSYRYDFQGPEKQITFSGSDEIDQLRNGDFALKSENDSGYGVEAILVRGKYFVKNHGGSFRGHQNDRGDAGTKKQEAYAAAESFWRLFEGRLAFADAGYTDHAGRQVRKYSVSFDPSLKPRTPGKPAAPTKDGGSGPPVRGKMEPKSASGMVLVDERARAIVRIDIKGSFTAGTDGAVRGTMEFKHEFGPIKPGIQIKEPEIAPEPKRPKIEKDPLGKLEGKKVENEKGGPAGGAGKKDRAEDSEGGQ